jgi:6-phosphogluconolactonase
MRNIEIYPDMQSLARAAAERIVSAAEAAMTTQNRFSIALAGGSTPRVTYQLLATSEFLPLIDWAQSHVFFGDERCVPSDHQDSNYHMAREALLDYVKIPMSSIYRMRGEDDPQQAAMEYESRMRAFFTGARAGGDAGRPRFDLVLLGMGEDGHTASLFPGTAALHERERWAAANYVEAKESWRLTLTVPALNAAEQVIFLVAGENKAEALRQVFSDESDPYQYPAKLIQPDDGQVLWLVDAAAAALL